MNIQINIPYDDIMNRLLNELDDKEKYLILKVGYDCLKNAKIQYSNINENEIEMRLKNKMEDDIKKIQLELQLEKELSKKIEEKYNNIYEKEKDRLTQKLNESNDLIAKLELDLRIETEKYKIKERDKINSYEMNINTLNERLLNYEKNIEEIVNSKLREKLDNLLNQEKIYQSQIERLNDRIHIIENTKNAEIKTIILREKEIYNKMLEDEKNKYILLLNERQNKVDNFVEKYQEIIMQSNKSTSSKGIEGEKQFEDYASTFIDFKGYEIIDKHTQGGQGDFHLHFDEFDVLVDAKNYKKKVPNEQREKIKNDLQRNEHLHFGWLVSLNTSIDKYDKSPVMYEWINTKQCLVYINNLSSFEDPKKLLRIVWFTCKELNSMIKDVDYDGKGLSKLREDRFKMIDKIKNLRKNIREINTSINITKNAVQLMDDELKLLLENETTEIMSSNISIFDEWWDNNIELVDKNVVSSSTNLWLHFKQDNMILLSEKDINVDKFKQYLKAKVPNSSIILRNKNANSAFDIKGIKLKVINKDSNGIIEEKLEVELNEKVLPKKIVKKVK